MRGSTLLGGGILRQHTQLRRGCDLEQIESLSSKKFCVLLYGRSGPCFSGPSFVAKCHSVPTAGSSPLLSFSYQVPECGQDPGKELAGVGWGSPSETPPLRLPASDGCGSPAILWRVNLAVGTSPYSPVDSVWYRADNQFPTFSGGRPSAVCPEVHQGLLSR